MRNMNETSDEHRAHPYDALTPDTMLDSLDSVGLHSDGRFLALNSYENRVYQVGVEDADPVVVKFYRPERWSDDAIIEEHQFVSALAQLEIPVVAPLTINNRQLHEYAGFRFAVYPRRGGRAPDLDNSDNLRWMGRFLARIHSLGRAKPFQHRPRISVENFGRESQQYLLQHDFIPSELRASYESCSEMLLSALEQRFPAQSGGFIRLHGDCHPGNVLWTDHGPHFVDFDDARMGPPIQDLWMLLSGSREEMTKQFAFIMEGYNEFFHFDATSLHLIEVLRSLRMIHYSAWLARRWQDPAFPANFPWFNSNRYWEEHILSLKEQIAAVQEEPISWFE